MIVFYDPETLAIWYTVNEPLHPQQEAHLESGADGQAWIRAKGNDAIGLTVERSPEGTVAVLRHGERVETYKEMRLSIEDGLILKNLPRPCRIKFKGGERAIEGGAVRFDLADAGSHNIVVEADGYAPKRFQLIIGWGL